MIVKGATLNALWPVRLSPLPRGPLDCLSFNFFGDYTLYSDHITHICQVGTGKEAY